MLKRRTSKKRGFCFEDMPAFKANRKAHLLKHDSEAFFQDFDKVGAALLESLIENDTEAFIDILDAYLYT